MNMKSYTKYQLIADFFVDPEFDNDPVEVFVFGQSKLGKSYERKVYNLNDMLGNVGGVYGIVQALCAAVVYIIAKAYIDTKYICIFEDPEYICTPSARSVMDKKFA